MFFVFIIDNKLNFEDISLLINYSIKSINTNQNLLK